MVQLNLTPLSNQLSTTHEQILALGGSTKVFTGSEKLRKSQWMSKSREYEPHASTRRSASRESTVWHRLAPANFTLMYTQYTTHITAHLNAQRENNLQHMILDTPDTHITTLFV